MLVAFLVELLLGSRGGHNGEGDVATGDGASVSAGDGDREADSGDSD